MSSNNTSNAAAQSSRINYEREYGMPMHGDAPQSQRQPLKTVVGTGSDMTNSLAQLSSRHNLGLNSTVVPTTTLNPKLSSSNNGGSGSANKLSDI